MAGQFAIFTRMLRRSLVNNKIHMGFLDMHRDWADHSARWLWRCDDVD
jgi:hypothetical protein